MPVGEAPLWHLGAIPLYQTTQNIKRRHAAKVRAIHKMKNTSKLAEVKNHDAIDIKPVKADWSAGYGETWDFFAGCRCDECGAVLVGRGGEKHCDINNESECDGYVETSEGPMMNYYYPLPGFNDRRYDANECARALASLPLCVVEFTDEGEYALALTGGGMDLSWEICEAFMRCGYLPPAHFANLPAMAGRGESRKDRQIISACRRSLRAVKARAAWALQSVSRKFKRAA